MICWEVIVGVDCFQLKRGKFCYDLFHVISVSYIPIYNNWYTYINIPLYQSELIINKLVICVTKNRCSYLFCCFGYWCFNIWYMRNNCNIEFWLFPILTDFLPVTTFTVLITTVYSYWLGLRTTADLFDPRMDLFPEAAGWGHQIPSRVKQNCWCPRTQSKTVLLYTNIVTSISHDLLNQCK